MRIIRDPLSMCFRCAISALLASSVFLCSANAQDSAPPSVKSVGTTYRDLQAVKKRAAFNQIQKKYYEAAIAALKKAAERGEHGGGVDKPELEEIIQDVQFVIDHDPILESNRVQLIHDVAQMRILRDQL